MASNFFGQIFRITTFGESHGPGIGVVIDGCPAGLPLTAEDIDLELARRKPGNRAHTSPRKEDDHVKILSGLFEGKTTGAPIALWIENRDVDTSPYEAIKHLYRPGHANFTYLEKYGVFDHRGGGRASARETAARVAAGAVAKKLLETQGIRAAAFLCAVGEVSCTLDEFNPTKLAEQTRTSPLFCPDLATETAMLQTLEETASAGDSLGGIVGCIAEVPVGLGDPVYHKLEALLAYAMLSLPASKGFEMGDGFAAARMKGSQHNDGFGADGSGNVRPLTNHAGGTLGGISTGEPLSFRVAFKPTSSIRKPQETTTLSGQTATLQLPVTARHDPCVAIRAVPVVEAMAALVLADALLLNRSAKL